jgi:hypothetical protein
VSPAWRAWFDPERVYFLARHGGDAGLARSLFERSARSCPNVDVRQRAAAALALAEGRRALAAGDRALARQKANDGCEAIGPQAGLRGALAEQLWVNPRPLLDDLLDLLADATEGG